MPKLLLEIGCEELPAWACEEGSAQLPELCERQLRRRPAEVYAGPRRLAVVVDELEERTPDEWVKGPPEALAERAAEGFARRHGVAVSELEPRDGFLGVTVPGKPLAEVLPERLEQIVRGFAFSRTMRWDERGLRFPRPVRWICALLDSEPVEVPVAPSGRVSYGRRFTHRRSRFRRPGRTPKRCARQASSRTARRASGGSPRGSTRSAAGATPRASSTKSSTSPRVRSCSRAGSTSASSSCPSAWS